MAFVLSESFVTVLDLEHPQRRPTIVDLTSSGHAIGPSQVLLDPGHSRIFVRGDSSEDVFSFRFVRRDTAEDRNDFSIAVDIVAAGAVPTDLALYELNGEQYFAAALPYTSELAVVDVATSRTVRVPLPTQIDRLMTRLVQTDQGLVLLAFGWRNGGTSVATVRMDLVEQHEDVAICQLSDLKRPVARILDAISGRPAGRNPGR